MARRKGSLNLSSNIEPSMAAPLDARSIADSVEELTASGSFPYAYMGMKVFVKSTKETYELIGDDPTDIANWRLFGDVKTVEGDKGDPGLSAYDIAVEEGFVGSKREWLQSLKGEKGDKGDDGNVGSIDMSSYAKKQDIPSMEGVVYEEALAEYAKKNELPSSVQDYVNDHKSELKGDSGYTPVRGTDYMTEDDLQYIKSQIDDSVQQIADSLPTKKQKAVITIMDDGDRKISDDNHIGLTSFLNEKGIPLCFAVSKAHTTEGSAYYTVDELHALEALGNEVVVRGTENNLTDTCTLEEFKSFMSEAKEWAESNGFAGNVCVYPNGLRVGQTDWDEKMHYVQSLGIEGAYSYKANAENYEIEGYEDWYSYENGYEAGRALVNVAPFVTMPNGLSKAMWLNRMETIRSTMTNESWIETLHEAIQNKRYIVLFFHCYKSEWYTAGEDGKTTMDLFRELINGLVDTYGDQIEWKTATQALQYYRNLTGEIDLSQYVKKSDLPSFDSFIHEEALGAYARKSEIPSVEGLVREDALSDYAKKSELPSLEGLVHENELDEYVKSSELPSLDGLVHEDDLGEYAKKTELPSVNLEAQVQNYLVEHKEELRGEEGKSAYDIAVENGFVGTPVEFLMSLQGAKGENGSEVAVTPSLTSGTKIAEIEVDGETKELYAPSDSSTDKMDKTDPTGTGSLSLNRKEGTNVGSKSVAIGNNVRASGTSSTAMGYNTEAVGYTSFAEGGSTRASANYTHSAGNNTVAGYENQFVSGKFNQNKEGTLFEVGNGNKDERSNAFEVYLDGSLSTDNGVTKTKLQTLPGVKRHKAVVIGDSYFDGADQYNFANHLRSKNLFEEVVDYAQGGTGFGHTYKDHDTLYEKLQNEQMRADIADADVIYMHLGGNDILSTLSFMSGNAVAEPDIYQEVQRSLAEIYTINPSVTIYYVPPFDYKSIQTGFINPAMARVVSPVFGVAISQIDAVKVLLKSDAICTAICNSDAKIFRLDTPASLLVEEFATDNIHPTPSAASSLFDAIINGNFSKTYLEHFTTLDGTMPETIQVAMGICPSMIQNVSDILGSLISKRKGSKNITALTSCSVISIKNDEARFDDIPYLSMDNFGYSSILVYPNAPLVSLVHVSSDDADMNFTHEDINLSPLERSLVPVEDGTYNLKVEKSGDKVTYSWVGSENVIPTVKVTEPVTEYTLRPGITYSFKVPLTELDVSFEGWSDEHFNEFHFIFISGETPTELVLSDDLLFPDDFSIEANRVYEINILDGLLLYNSWSMPVESTEAK